MKKITFLVIYLVLCSVALNAFAESNRREVPRIMINSYYGIGLGKGYYNFSNDDLDGAFQAVRINNELTSGTVYTGHYFNKYLALQLSIMRPFAWIKYKGLFQPDSSNSVRITLYGLTLRPTLPVNNRFSLYGEAGIGYITRHGITDKNNIVLEDAQVTTPVTGAGLTYQLARSWYADAGFTYSFSDEQHNQPEILFTALRIHYRIWPSSSTNETDNGINQKDDFPHRLIQVGGFNREFYYWEPHKYFHPPNIPIFWIGDVKLDSGMYLMYEQNIFHTRRWVSFELGASISHWESNELNDTFDTYSIFPAVRIWLVRNKKCDLYVTYSAVGPTYITKSFIDNIDTGGNFTFQDFMGIGIFLGEKKRININSKIMHYSNGYIFPQNNGIAVPSTLAIGYSF